jgi:hypothetical protein
MRAIGTMKTMATITTGDTGNIDMHQFRGLIARSGLCVCQRANPAQSSLKTFRLLSISLANRRLAFGRYPTCPFEETFTYCGSLLRSGAPCDCAEPPAKYPASPRRGDVPGCGVGLVSALELSWALSRDGVDCEGGFARLPVTGVDSPGPLRGAWAGGGGTRLWASAGDKIFLSSLLASSSWGAR